MDGAGVMVHDGRLTYSVSVAGTKGIKLPFGFELHYDSSLNHDGFEGWNWTSILDAKATILGGGDVKVFLPPYGEETWGYNGGGPLIKPTGAVIEVDPDPPVITCTTPGGFAWIFNSSSGVIDKVEDRFGNDIDYSWSGGVVTNAVDSRGETHVFDFWANTSRLKSITTADGRAWFFPPPATNPVLAARTRAGPSCRGRDGVPREGAVELDALPGA